MSLAVLICSFFLFKKASGSMAFSKLNMLSYLFYVPMFAMSFLGAVFIVLKLDDHYLINKLRYDETRLIGWLAVLYTMIMLPAGMLLAKRIFFKGSIQKSFEHFAQKPVIYLLGKNELILKSILIGLSLFGSLVMIYTFYSIGMVPILEMFKGNSEELARIRILASREFSGNIYLRNIFALQFLPLLSFVAFAYYQKSKSLLDLSWFLITFFSALMILSYDLQKSPMAMFLTGFVFYIVWVNGKIALHKLAFIVFLFIGIIASFYIGFGNENIAHIFLSYNTGASGRILFSQLAGTFFSFEFFDSMKEFIGFNSMSKLVNNFGIEYAERAGRLIMEVINPKGIKEGTAGVQNTLFIGEAWANFGFLGLLLSPVYVGFMIGSLFYTLMRLPKTPLLIGIYVFFSYKTAIIGGFNDYLYNVSTLSVFVLFGLILIYSSKLSKSISNE
ncbi:MAG: hypothetical protein ACI8V8_000371 [Chitinophagales bacterium]